MSQSNNAVRKLAAAEQGAKAVESFLPGHLGNMLKKYQTEGFTRDESFRLVRDQLACQSTQAESVVKE